MHKLPVITTSHHATEALGLTLPFQLTSNASLTDHAFEELELHGPDAALRVLEEKLADGDDWKAWHQYVHIANGCTDVAMIRGDDDLASLHDNDEFKRLITELDAR